MDEGFDLFVILNKIMETLVDRKAGDHQRDEVAAEWSCESRVQTDGQQRVFRTRKAGLRLQTLDSQPEF